MLITPVWILAVMVSQVVTGSQLAEMDDDRLQWVLDFDQIVFARTSPMQKLRIVKGLQVRICFLIRSTFDCGPTGLCTIGCSIKLSLLARPYAGCQTTVLYD